MRYEVYSVRAKEGNVRSKSGAEGHGEMGRRGRQGDSGHGGEREGEGD